MSSRIVHLQLTAKFGEQLRILATSLHELGDRDGPEARDRLVDHGPRPRRVGVLGDAKGPDATVLVIAR